MFIQLLISFNNWIIKVIAECANIVKKSALLKKYVKLKFKSELRQEIRCRRMHLNENQSIKRLGIKSDNRISVENAQFFFMNVLFKNVPS